MDTAVIPSGDYCYKIVRIEEGEVLSEQIEQFGLELREYRYNRYYKEILCPYWQRTGYGTVRCVFLDREFIDDLDEKAHEKLVAHFGSSEAVEQFEYSWKLPDEVKICGIHEDDDDTE